MASEFDQGLIDNFNELVERKKTTLNKSSEDKVAEFVTHNMSLNSGSYDGDSTEGNAHGYTNPLGFRLGTNEGNISLDAFETPKYNDQGEVLPYLGSTDTTDGSKRSKKWDLHRTSYAKRFGLPSKEYVSQKMLNDEALVQAEQLKNITREGHIVGETQYDRPAFYMDGEVVSEKSTTIEMDGKWINIPTIWDGKQLSEDEIKQKLINNEIRPTSIHSNQKDALLAAQTRTAGITDINFTGDVPLDVKFNDLGYFDRDLITARNPVTSVILNDALNTPENNASYYSKYNRDAWMPDVEAMRAAQRGATRADGEGFWSAAKQGVSSGVDNLQATGYGFAALIADATGNEEFATAMLQEYLANIEEAQRNGAGLPNVEDVDWSNPQAALSKLGSLLGEAIPSIAMMMGTGGIFGAIGKYAVKRKVKGFAAKEVLKQVSRAGTRGRTAGAYLGANVMETGGIYGDVASEGNRDATAIAGSLLGGSIAAGLEIVTPLTLMNKMGFGKAATETVRKTLLKNGLTQALKKVGKEFLAGGSIEGVTEGLQFVIEETTQDLIKSGELPEYMSDEFKSGLLNSVVAGFVPGGTLRGGTSIVSETVKQVKGDEKVVNEEVRRVADEAVEARNEDVTPYDMESEKQLAEVIKQIESIDTGIELNANITSNLDKAQAYLDGLNTTENQEFSNEAGDITANAESLKDDLNTAIEAYQSGDLKTQYKKDSAPNQRQYESDANHVDDVFDNLIKTYPNRTAAYERMRKIQLDHVARQATKRQKPINKAAKPGNDAFTKVISTNIQSSLDKIEAISTKLSDETINKKHRKRLERERNNHGLLVESLQGLNVNDISSKLSNAIDTSLNSFEYAHRKTDTISTEEVASDIASLKETDSTLNTYDKDKGADKVEVAEAKVKWLKDRQKLIADRDQTIRNAENTNDKATLKKQRILIKGIDDTISQLDKRFDIIKDDASQNETLPIKEDKLNSLDIESLGNADVLNSIDPDSLNKSDKQTYDLRNIVTKTFQKIKQTIGNSKNLEQVHDDVITGRDTHFKGFKAFLNDAKAGKFNAERFNSFISGLRKKAGALNRAQGLAKKHNIRVYVNKETLKVTRQPAKGAKVVKGVSTNTGEAVTTTYANYWWVDSKSDKFIALVNQEVELGVNTGAMINQVLNTAEGRSKELEQQSRLQEANAKIAKLIDKSTPTVDSNLENVKAEDKAVKQEAVVDPDVSKAKGVSLEDSKVIPIKYVDKIISAVDGKTRIAARTDRENNQILIDKAEVQATFKRKAWTVARVEGVKPYHADAFKTVEEWEMFLVEHERAHFTEENLKRPKGSVRENHANTVAYTYVEAAREASEAVNPKVEQKTKEKVVVPQEQKAKPETKVEKVQEKVTKIKEVVKPKVKKVKVLANSFLNKFKDKFLPLRDSLLKVTDIFKTKDINRVSFFSKNTDETLTAKTIAAKLKDLGITDTAYIKAVTDHFEMFKETFNTKVLVKLTNKDKEGILALYQPHHLLSTQEGTVPDEVLFSMMLSVMHWSSISQNLSENTPRYVIASLLYGDPKQVARLTAEQINTFSDAGIFIKHAAKDIGIEIFDLLNIKADKETELALSIHMDLEKLSPAFKDEKILIKDTVIGNRASTAFGLLALQTAKHMYLPNPKSKIIEDGLIDIVHGQYSAKLFEDSNMNLEVNTDGNISINTIQVQRNDDIDKVLTIFKEGADNLKLIKGAETALRDIFSEPVDTVQQKATNSFYELPKLVKDLIEKLQNVRWIGKKSELSIFKILSDETMHMLIGVKDLTKQHDTHRDAVDAANNEKINDVAYVNDYIAGGIKGFYYKYKAQAQHRLRIVSNTINGQRSKIHRALFFPANKTSVVKSESDRAVFKLAVGQAFGVGIDKQTLKKSLSDFEAIYTHADIQELITLIANPEKNATKINALIVKLVDAKVIDASMHVLEGVVALSQYKDGNFETTIGIETDGITNGYAIGLLQFLGGTPQELKQRLARVGIFVDANDAVNTYEKFIADGRLDIYQSLAHLVVTELKATVKPKLASAIDVLHGEFIAKDTGKLTKFARDLAKNPLMITNYGAGVAKVIQGIIDDIVPSLYTKLADIQTRYDNADIQGKKLIRNEVTNIEEAIFDLIGKKVALVSRLDKKFKTVDAKGNKKGNGLYSFEFNRNITRQIEGKFNSVYADIIEVALDDLIGPIKEAREIIVQAIEAQYFAFINAFEKETVGISNVATRMAIAGKLADKYMPRMSGPWSTNKDELIQLIKTESNQDKAVQIKHKESDYKVYKRNGKNWDPLRTGTADTKGNKAPQYLEANIFTPDFANPGVASAINMVQNMDSVVLGDLLIANPEVLPIFDAVISSVNDAISNAAIYNEAFKQRALSHSFLADTKTQLAAIFDKMSATELAEVNKRIQEKGYAGVGLQKELTEAKNNKQRLKITKKIKALTVKTFNEKLEAKITEVAEQRKAMEEAFGKDWMNVVSQMYLPESLADLEGAVETKESDATIEVANDTADGVMSSIDIDAKVELEWVYDTNSLRANLQNIFDKLSSLHSTTYHSSAEKQNQQGHLQRVLGDIINKAGDSLDNTTVTLNKANVKAHGHANIGEESVDVNFNKYSPLTYSEQSPQEVYVHELLHILTRSALLLNSGFKTQIRNIRNTVKQTIEQEAKENGVEPYEMFLRKNDKGDIIYLTDKDSEIVAAKAQYAYLFGHKVPPKAVLDEFLAYALSNKFLVDKLSSMPASKTSLWSTSPTDSVVEKIFKMFSEIINVVISSLNKKHKSASLEMEIFSLTKDIVAVNQSKRTTVSESLRLNLVGKNIDDANRIISNFVETNVKDGIKIGSDKYIKLVDKITKEGKVNNFLANVLYDTKLVALLTSSYQEFVDNHPEVQERLNKAFRNFKPNTLKNLSSLKADMFGGVDQDFIRLLYKSHKEVDANRRQYKELTKESLQKVFKDYDSLTDSDKESITRVLLKTDLSALIDKGTYTLDEVLELVASSDKLQVEINKYAKRLDVKKNRHYDIQTKQLAKIMVKGKTNNHNQYLNAYNIYHTNPHASTYVSKQGNELDDLDVYISMLALRETTTDSKEIFMNVAIQEFALDGKHNGIHGVINLHSGFKAKSLKEGFDSNPALMIKGYISVITDPDVDVQVESTDPVMQYEMERKGYTYIGKLHDITGISKNVIYGVYVLKNNPEIRRTKGIMSATAKKAKGTSIKDILSRDESNFKLINAKFKQFSKAQAREANKLDYSNFTMIPVVNEELEIVDYRINMQHAAIEQYMKQDLMFDEVLPTMFSQVEDKIKSEAINNEAIELLYDYGQANYKTNPSKFIDILSSKYKSEYFDVLPKQARWLIEQRATVNQDKNKLEFFVERGFLDTVFGYQNPSLSNVRILHMHPKAQRYIKVFEKLIKEAVSMAVVNIVIKIPIVPAVNFTSNFITSMLYGVPPTYLVKTWYEGVNQLNEYRTKGKELKLLDIAVLSNPALKTDKTTIDRREELVHDMNNNPVAMFVDAGLFNSITEDINQNEFTYRNKGFNKIKDVGNKLFRGKVFDVANHAYLGEHTAVFKAAMHFTQMSDFIARYTLYKYNTEVKGMSDDKAWKLIVETFVNYDQPLNRYLQWSNDIGAVLFVKYWLRIQRAGFNLIKEKPLNVGLLYVGNSMLDLDIETILNTSVLVGNFFPTLGGFEKIAEEVIIPPGLEIALGEGF
jgi:hypothetical protein